MLDPEIQVTSSVSEYSPRALVVVDGSKGGWNALAWAVGYARSRGIGRLEATLYTGGWHYVPCAGEASALMPAELSTVAQEAAWRNTVQSAREFCADSGLQLAFSGRHCRSSRELVNVARRDRPDLVVLGHLGSARRAGTRFIASRLIRRGIAVAVIP